MYIANRHGDGGLQDTTIIIRRRFGDEHDTQQKLTDPHQKVGEGIKSEAGTKVGFRSVTRSARLVREEGKLNEAGLQMGIEILFASDMRKRIKDIKIPVILLHGENDVIAYPKAARWMHEHLQSSKLIMLPHCGHTPFLSHADQFIANIIHANNI